jgi:hypothetical protein
MSPATSARTPDVVVEWSAKGEFAKKLQDYRDALAGLRGTGSGMLVTANHAILKSSVEIRPQNSIKRFTCTRS